MARPVMRNNRGFTLLEVTIAMLIFVIIMLGTLKGLTGSYQFILNNALRDHAVRFADEILTNYRNVPFTNPLLDLGSTASLSDSRQLNNMTVTYNATVTVANVVTNIAKSVTVQVDWTSRGTSHSYTTSTIVANR